MTTETNVLVHSAPQPQPFSADALSAALVGLHIDPMAQIGQELGKFTLS